jgi:hypothetical protein
MNNVLNASSGCIVNKGVIFWQVCFYYSFFGLSVLKYSKIKKSLTDLGYSTVVP